VYKQQFEGPFLASSAKYYEAEADAHAKTLAVEVYLHKVGWIPAPSLATPDAFVTAVVVCPLPFVW
jgi:hypothetical protein